MRIACLGWGSLIWDPRELRVGAGREAWRSDGPELPIEFARQSSGNRLTLVVLPEGRRVQTLWAEMQTDDIAIARSSLRKREGTLLSSIAVWPSHERCMHAEIIASWAARNAIDAVVWTAVEPKFDGEVGRIPSAAEAVAYLRDLIDRGSSSRAEEYVRKTPSQIATPHRAVIERELAWTPLG